VILEPRINVVPRPLRAPSQKLHRNPLLQKRRYRMPRWWPWRDRQSATALRAEIGKAVPGRFRHRSEPAFLTASAKMPVPDLMATA
jgi:hypothetical protein